MTSSQALHCWGWSVYKDLVGRLGGADLNLLLATHNCGWVEDAEVLLLIVLLVVSLWLLYDDFMLLEKGHT